MRKSTFFSIVAIVLISVVGAATGWAGEAEEEAASAQVRVGTFDSRAVAMAYYRSEAHREYIKGMMAELKAAKEAGDEERAQELQAEGEASQALAHKQSFGTYPVDEILVKIEQQIPEIAERAGVDVIVSKWDVVHQAPGVELVDVTLMMVEPFNPDEATVKMIREQLPKHAPVPLKELEEHQH